MTGVGVKSLEQVPPRGDQMRYALAPHPSGTTRGLRSTGGGLPRRGGLHTRR